MASFLLCCFCFLWVITLIQWVRFIIISPFYWCENWGSGGIQYLAQGRSASRWRSQDLDLGLCLYPLPSVAAPGQDKEPEWPCLFCLHTGCERNVWVHRHWETYPIQQKLKPLTLGLMGLLSQMWHRKLESGTSVFRPQLNHWLALWPWARY